MGDQNQIKQTQKKNKKQVRFDPEVEQNDKVDNIVKKRKLNDERKQHSIDNLILDGQNSNRKKWNQQATKSGKFSESEINIIKHQICKYIQKKGLGIEGLQKFINSKRDSEIAGAWVDISEALPERSVYSIHKWLKRYFTPDNNQGKWTKREEELLIQEVEQHGRKWETISIEFGRTAANIRDKFKELGGSNWQYRVKNNWTLYELIQLIQQIEKNIEVKFIKRDEFKKIMKQNKQDPEFLQQKITKKKKSIKDPQNLLQIIKNMIDYAKFRQIKSKKKINWTKISEVIISKSVDDCRNIWRNQIENIIYSDTDYTNDQIMTLIQSIMEQDVDNEEELVFRGIENEKTISENQYKWKILKKQVGSREDKNIYSICKEIIANFTQYKSESEFDSDTDSYVDKVDKAQKKNKNRNQFQDLIEMYESQYENI